MRIRAPPTGKIDLIPLNSDQNTLCDYNGIDFCYFIIYVKKVDTSKNLFIHVFQDKQSTFEIYARNLTTAELNIREKLPNPQNAVFSSMKQLNTNYLLISLEKVLLTNLVIAVRSKEKGTISLLSSLYTYTNKLKEKN